jgi:hypothetical protein
MKAGILCSGFSAMIEGGIAGRSESRDQAKGAMNRREV